MQSQNSILYCGYVLRVDCRIVCILCQFCCVVAVFNEHKSCLLRGEGEDLELASSVVPCVMALTQTTATPNGNPACV